MWILQEYRFYLIIAVLVLAGMLVLFFNTNNKQESIQFTSTLTENYAKVQNVEGKTLLDVMSSNGTSILAMKDNTLYGKTLSSNASDVLYIDDFSQESLNTLTIEKPENGEFSLAILTKESFESGDDSISDVKTLWTIDAANTNEAGLNFTSSNAAKLYIYDSEATAKDIMVTYIPEGELVETTDGVVTEKNAILLPFTQNAGVSSKAFNPTSFMASNSSASAPAPAAEKFSITIDTSHLTSGLFRIPSDPAGVYSFNVDWGDGTSEYITAESQIFAGHTYSTPWIYTIEIDWTYIGYNCVNRIGYVWRDSCYAITAINSWGDMEFTDTGYYFYSHRHLTDLPDTFPTPGLTNFEYAFNAALNFNDPDIGNWDMTSVENAFLMFSNAQAFNQDISSWNFGSNITDARLMFDGASVFDQDISNWDLSSLGYNAYLQSQFSGRTTADWTTIEKPQF